MNGNRTEPAPLAHGLREATAAEQIAVAGGLSWSALPQIVVRMLAPLLYGGTAPYRPMDP
jgi:hypothetical protein